MITTAEVAVLLLDATCAGANVITVRAGVVIDEYLGGL